MQNWGCLEGWFQPGFMKKKFLKREGGGKKKIKINVHGQGTAKIKRTKGGQEKKRQKKKFVQGGL